MKQGDRIAAFRELHIAGCFVLPNPWDAGTARVLAGLGFRALATSSAALAFAEGLPDSPTALSLETTLAHCRAVVGATPLPVNADFQAGYGASADAVGAHVTACIATGVAGLSIEDASGDPQRPLFEAAHAVDRVRAARAAIDADGRGVVLTARAEGFLVGDPHLGRVIDRLVAFAEAGADCLFAPGLRRPEDIAAVVRAVAPKPVNVLAADPGWMTRAALADLGVRRISVGSALARVAWRAFRAAAEDIAATGSLQSLAAAEPFATFERWFGEGGAR